MNARQKLKAAEMAKGMAKSALTRWPDTDIANDNCETRLRTTFGVSEEYARSAVISEKRKRGL